MIWFLIAFGVLWVAGWFITVMSLSPLQNSLWSKVKMMAVMFFLWPILLWALANHGDI